MTQALLLDTCALLWSVDPTPNAQLTREILARANADQTPVHISPVSAQEIGLLLRKGRLALAVPVRQWFAVILSQPRVRIAALSVDVMLASNDLPDLDHKDPSDRLLIATAREQGLRIVTRDRAILAYAGRGHVLAIAC